MNFQNTGLMLGFWFSGCNCAVFNEAMICIFWLQLGYFYIFICWLEFGMAVKQTFSKENALNATRVSFSPQRSEAVIFHYWKKLKKTKDVTFLPAWEVPRFGFYGCNWAVFVQHWFFISWLQLGCFCAALIFHFLAANVLFFVFHFLAGIGGPAQSIFS